MKKSFLLLLLIANLINISGQTNTDDQDKERYSKNNVKRQIQWQYDIVNGKTSAKGIQNMSTWYDGYGNPVEIINFDVAGAVRSVLTYTYDAKGNKTSYSRYKDNKKILTYNQNIKYDDKGNKASETGFDGANKFTNLFTYDGNGKISEISYKTDNVLTERRSFRHTGNIMEMIIYNANNVILSKETTKFDSKNNVMEETKYVQDNVMQKANYSYDNAGNKVEESKENLGKLAYRRKYTYNNQGKIIQITEEKEDVKPFISYMYKYDAKGNLIEEKWKKDPENEYSTKVHKYDSRGLLLETQSYNASFKVSVLYKYSYVYFTPDQK